MQALLAQMVSEAQERNSLWGGQDSNAGQSDNGGQDGEGGKGGHGRGDGRGRGRGAHHKRGGSNGSRDCDVAHEGSHGGSQGCDEEGIS
jgi:hypothetical protein